MDSPGPDREEKMLAEALEELKAQPAYRINEDGDDLIVRVPKTLATRERVSRFLDWLEFDQLRSQSELTEEDAAAFAAEVKRAVWDQNRQRLNVTDDSSLASTVREKAVDLMQRLPPDADVEEVMEQLYFLSKVERGFRQIDEGHGVSHEDAKRRFGR
ncbi:MAG TPA: hypothetical protein VGC13_07840 [Longimicrobium sp.]|jgi:hypothetical protein|uniref:hypothetical protein n=1 Tax=Longimicrobium sp. TaxID=2029185 RepID=UPI002ED98FA5